MGTSLNTLGVVAGWSPDRPPSKMHLLHTPDTVRPTPPRCNSAQLSLVVLMASCAQFCAFSSGCPKLLSWPYARNSVHFPPDVLSYSHGLMRAILCIFLRMSQVTLAASCAQFCAFSSGCHKLLSRPYARNSVYFPPDVPSYSHGLMRAILCSSGCPRWSSWPYARNSVFLRMSPVTLASCAQLHFPPVVLSYSHGLMRVCVPPDVLVLLRAILCSPSCPHPARNSVPRRNSEPHAKKKRPLTGSRGAGGGAHVGRCRSGRPCAASGRVGPRQSGRCGGSARSRPCRSTRHPARGSAPPTVH